MKAINTINGKVTEKDVDLISPHEHLFIDMTHEAIQPQTPEAKDLFQGDINMINLGALCRNPYIIRTNLILDNVDTAITEIEHVRKKGVNLMVDLTTVGLGRDIDKLKMVNEHTNMDIVVGCGLFTHDTIPNKYSCWSIDKIADWMISEIENGIENTGIKAGVIGEIGTSEKIYPVEVRALKAAAIASVNTGLSVFIHTYPWSRAGLEAVDIVMENGVSPERICVCHLDVTFDEEYLNMMLQKGVYVEFDNFGKEFYFESQDGAFAGGPFETDLARVRMLKRLIENGYGHRLLIANDLCLKTMLRSYGGWGYDHVLTNIVPMMRMEGIAEHDINKMVKGNPIQFLFSESTKR